MPILPHHVRSAVSVARSWVSVLGALVVPVVCPGCGEHDVPWCPACVATLAPGPPRRVEAGAPRLDRLDGVAPLPVWACTSYSGPVREMVPAWKDQGRLDLTPLMSATLTAAGTALAPCLPSRLVVVPVPTTAAARRRRGEDLVAGLATALATGLGRAGCDAEVRHLLSRRRSKDQAGMGARARGRVQVHLRGPAPRGTSVLLVDDVLTTGGTLAACERVLAGAGVLVLAAVVLAATPSSGGPRPLPEGSSCDTPRGDLRPVSRSTEAD